MCNGGQAKRLTSLESWILGEGRPAMGISLSAVYFSSLKPVRVVFRGLGFISCCMLFCASFLCFFLGFLFFFLVLLSWLLVFFLVLFSWLPVFLSCAFFPFRP
jgi:hypothetical protein